MTSNRTNLELKPNTIAQDVKNMKVHLLNSAGMPQAGTYSLEKYEAETWKAELKAAINDDVDFQQYIGYLSTLTFVGYFEHLIKKEVSQ